MKIRVVCDEKIPFLKNALHHRLVDAVFLSGSEIQEKNVENADALFVRTRSKCNEKTLKNSSVKFIATATIGFDHLDLEYLGGKNIFWCNAPGCNSESVAQYLSSVMVRYLKPGSTVGVIGVGNVGKIVAKFAALLGHKVLLNDPPREQAERSGIFTPLPKLLAASDLVTLHVPLNPTTENMAGTEFFSRMRSGGIFVNTSRGEVHCEDALLAELNRKRLRAVLDVWRNEPEINRALLPELSESTAHIAGYSLDGKANATAQCLRSFGRFFKINDFENYRISSLPEPENKNIYYHELSTSTAAILHSYDLRADSLKLLSSPENFEQLRNNYPLRREFRAFKLNDFPAVERDVLKEMGFQVAEQ